MVAFSFQPRFVRPIRVGLGHHQVEPPFTAPKRQTIRALRRDRRAHAKIGDILQLYCRQRHPGGFLIGRAQCRLVCPITLVFNDDDRDEEGVISPGVGLIQWGFSGLDDFARGDGFENWKELREFWRQTHPGVDMFEGAIIFWERLADE
jgi:hypothetical protein